MQNSRTFEEYVEAKLDGFSGGAPWREMDNSDRFFLMHDGHPRMREGLFLICALQGREHLCSLVSEYSSFLTPKMFAKLANSKNSRFHRCQHAATLNYVKWRDEWDEACEKLMCLPDGEWERLMAAPDPDAMLAAGFPLRCAKYVGSWRAKLEREEPFSFTDQPQPADSR